MITKIGPHKVKHGNIMDGIKDLMNNEKAEIYYGDPPWGGGNIKYWQTMNLKMNNLSKEDRRDVDYNNFINKVFSTIKEYTKGIVFIEYGVKWRDDIINLSKQYGFEYMARVDLVYNANNLPLDLHIFKVKGRPDLKLSQEFIQSITNTKLAKTSNLAIGEFAKPGEIVLDATCGMGFSAKACLKHSMIFRGNELNKTRLDKAINFINKKVGG